MRFGILGGAVGLGAVAIRGGGLIALVLLLASCRDRPDRPDRPNLLLIVADDLGYADLGVHGSIIRTPNIDGLAAEGMLFTQFHTAPSCAPTRAMLLTGNNNHVAGMGLQNTRIEGVMGYENRLTDRVAPLPRILSEAGYHTSTVGKWHLGNDADEGPPSAGFERSWSLIQGGGSHFSSVGFAEGGSTYRADGAEVSWPEGAYSTDLYTDLLLDFLDEAREQGQPFFAYAAYTSPHWPLQVPDDELDRYSGRFDEGYDVWRERNFANLQAARIVPESSALPPRNASIVPWEALSADRQRVESREMELYAAMVENLDQHVGRVVTWLREHDLYDQTVIVFMSDNGAAPRDWWRGGEAHDYIRSHYDNDWERMGRAGSWVSYGPEWADASSAPFSMWKTYARQGGIVAPMIVRDPRTATGGAIEDAYVTVMDVAPTLLELAGASYPEDEHVRPMLGESMAPLLAGERDRVHEEDYVTVLHHAGRAVVRQGRWKLVSLEPPFDEETMQLYDLVADPGETRDLRDAMPQRHAEMLELWRSERARLGIVLPGEN
jgi:arylsulfatase